jgi:hypothetical protein
MKITKILFAHAFVIDQIKFIMVSNKLITGGIDSKVRIWNFESEKMIDKIDIEAYACVQIAVLT